MNLLADAMEPYLLANTIRFTRNTPDMTAASSIRQANSGSYDFYLALHSNASADGSREGTVRGIIAFYYPGSANGKRAAGIFVRNLKDIYPLPDKVYTSATTALGEVRQPYMPSVLLELGYHDNTADALWVENNLEAIAANLNRRFGMELKPGNLFLTCGAAPGLIAVIKALLADEAPEEEPVEEETPAEE